MRKKSGADINFDPNPSPVPGMKIILIRGVPSQLEEAVKLINQMFDSKVCLFQICLTLKLTELM